MARMRAVDAAVLVLGKEGISAAINAVMQQRGNAALQIIADVDPF